MTNNTNNTNRTNKRKVFIVMGIIAALLAIIGIGYGCNSNTAVPVMNASATFVDEVYYEGNLATANEVAIIDELVAVSTVWLNDNTSARVFNQGTVLSVEYNEDIHNVPTDRVIENNGTNYIAVNFLSDVLDWDISFNNDGFSTVLRISLPETAAISETLRVINNSLNISVDETVTLNIVYESNYTKTDLQISSGNVNVATVEGLVVKAVGAGSTIVTVTTPNGLFEDVYVTVNNPIEIDNEDDDQTQNDNNQDVNPDESNSQENSDSNTTDANSAPDKSTASSSAEQKPETPAQSKPETSKPEAPAVPETKVATSYKSGMTRAEVHAGISDAIAPYGCWLMENGAISTDGANGSNIAVNTTSTGFKISISGWRRSKQENDYATELLLKSVRATFNFFYGSAGDATFLWYDEFMTSGYTADTDDFGITLTDLGNQKYRLTHNKSGVSMIYVQEDSRDVFYVG